MSLTIEKEVASESGHWYWPDGRPCYEIAKKDSGMRPTTLRDAKKLGLVPSVTTVLGILNKPGLNAWSVDQMLYAAMTLPREQGESEDSYISRIRTDAKATAAAARDLGTWIHGSLEQYYRGDGYPAEHHGFVKGAVDALSEHFAINPDDAEWMVEKSFACEDGYGGKVDLAGDLWDDPQVEIIVDFKTKDFTADKKGKDLAWPEMCWQLAAYRHGLKKPEAHCANVFISTRVPGLAYVHEWTPAELECGLNTFLRTLDLWKVLKGVK